MAAFASVLMSALYRKLLLQLAFNYKSALDVTSSFPLVGNSII